MKIVPYIFIFTLVLTAVSGCEEENVDDQKPEIDLTIPGAFPTNCDTLYFGETFTLKMKFSDNAELGSYSIDIHNNFDHHSHSTEVTECQLSPKKDPVNPFLFIQDYSITEGVTEYTTTMEISIPSGDSDGNFDEGDYHFFFFFTDKEGWSTKKGLSIKMLHRQQ